VTHLIRRLQPTLIALVGVALSVGLVFGAQPTDGWGLSNAAEHAGKVVPVKAGQVLEGDEDADTDEDVDTDEDTDTDEDVDTDEDTDTDEDVDAGPEEDGDAANCATDPTGLSEEALAALKHGSVVCWAAHQADDVWAGDFANHGQWVKSWAKKEKAEETTDEDATDEDAPDEDASDEDAGATSAGGAHGKGQGRGKAHSK
jgi:hypothetical protein